MGTEIEKKERTWWLVPPSLDRSMESFEAVCDVLLSSKRKTPLMIMGDTGVGKTLFVKEFKKQYGEKNPDAAVVHVNISAFPETLIESQLFGHRKGAFTGAAETREGLVEKADLLILEEIGELTPFTQSKLLTFIEDNQYVRLGDNKISTAKDIQIIATTNKRFDTEKDFRPDFYHRFFHFTVPALHERREDILYYFAYFALDTLRELHPWEMMTLLSHNWPGNVRELETFCKEIECIKIERIKNPNRHIPSIDSSFFEAATMTQTKLTWYACQRFYNSLKMNGIDVAFLEKELNRFSIGLDCHNTAKPFENVSLDNLSHLDLFFGLDLFSGLFCKSCMANINLLSERTGRVLPPVPPESLLFKKPTAKHRKLIADCKKYVGLTGELRETDPLPAPKNKELSETDHLLDMTEAELRKVHYQFAVEKHQTKRAAAEHLGLNETTLKGRLKRLGITKK